VSWYTGSPTGWISREFDSWQRQKIFFLHSVYFEFGAHPASCPKDTMGSSATGVAMACMQVSVCNVYNMSGLQQALLTAKHMLSLWRALYEDQTITELPDQSEKRSDTRSVFQLYTSEMSDKDSSKYVCKLYGVKNCNLTRHCIFNLGRKQMLCYLVESTCYRGLHFFLCYGPVLAAHIHLDL
jgi:hypothetical protein